MCEVRTRKNGQKQKKKKEKKSTVVSSKKKSTVMNPIRRQMKKRNPSSGQNGQLVHWWLLIHSGHVSTSISWGLVLLILHTISKEHVTSVPVIHHLAKIVPIVKC